MGVSSAIQEQKGKSNGLAKLWNNHEQISTPNMREESQEVKRRVVFRKRSSCRRRPKRVIVMKRKRMGGVVRRVRTLKTLVPSTDSQEGLDGLFRDTADYILTLQMRVRVMQIMVNVLSANSEE